MKRSNGTSELVDAALAIEEQLSGIEDAAGALEKTTLGTEKSIKRAARELGTAAEGQEKLAESLRSLAHVMMRLQQRQNKAIERLAAFAESLRSRNERMSQLMQRYASLGTKAGELAETLSDAGALEATRTTLAELGDEAKKLGQDAESEGFGEIAREANALKQKLQSTLAKLNAGKAS